MKQIIKWFSDDEKRTYFLGGGVGGIAPGIGFLLDVQYASQMLLIAFVVKLAAAIVMAFGCGIAAALAADVYKKTSGYVKKKFKKDENKAA
jgi:hypothetical protein